MYILSGLLLAVEAASMMPSCKSLQLVIVSSCWAALQSGVSKQRARQSMANLRRRKTGIFYIHWVIDKNTVLYLPCFLSFYDIRGSHCVNGKGGVEHVGSRSQCRNNQFHEKKHKTGSHVTVTIHFGSKYSSLTPIHLTQSKTLWNYILLGS